MRKIGIIGGGPLGRMTIEAARKYLAQVEVLAPEYPSPASEIADAAHVGAIDDYESVLEFAEELDVLSCQIEGASLEALWELERRGKILLPSAGILAAAGDKCGQRNLLASAGIPTSRVELLSACKDEDADAPPARGLAGVPPIQRNARGGALPARSLDAKDFVDFERELAVVVARSPDGSCAAYPCAEMVLDERRGANSSTLAPARISVAQRAEAERIALACANALCSAAEGAGSPGSGSGGVFVVELFLTRSGDVLANHIVPRPQGAGHFSIEACASNQFDQCARVLLGLPLGSPELLRPVMTIGLYCGPECGTGPAEYEGLKEALCLPGVSAYLYGHREARPLRKMGHLAAIGATADEAIERALAARDLVRVTAR